MRPKTLAKLPEARTRHLLTPTPRFVACLSAHRHEFAGTRVLPAASQSYPLCHGLANLPKIFVCNTNVRLHTVSGRRPIPPQSLPLWGKDPHVHSSRSQEMGPLYTQRHGLTQRNWETKRGVGEQCCVTLQVSAHYYCCSRSKCGMKFGLMPDQAPPFPLTPQSQCDAGWNKSSVFAPLLSSLGWLFVRSSGLLSKLGVERRG
jgi:hypothetical protein